MEISESVEIMKSLSDTSRLRVLNSLITKPQYVEELAKRMDLAESTISFHLKKLEKAGLVYKVKEQYYITYHVCDEIFDRSLKELINFDNPDEFIQDERIKNYRKRVLKTFFKKEKLEKLPVQRKKRMIILDEFVKKFIAGKKYHEDEVNQIIMQSYFDYCTIRRLMIDEGIMNRKNQIYWINKQEIAK
jgi:hypothetical protein